MKITEFSASPDGFQFVRVWFRGSVENNCYVTKREICILRTILLRKDIFKYSVCKCVFFDD